MSVDAFVLFLGVAESAEPAALLGLSGGAHQAPAIEAALRFRLSQVYMHPQGRTEEADAVRRRLREIAASMLAAVRGPPPPRAAAPRVATATQPAPLTDFDRQVMALLARNGGWNARARGHLFRLASAYGVSAQGLVKVVAGLHEYARSGPLPSSVGPVGVAPATAPPVAVAASMPDSDWAPAEPGSRSDWIDRAVPELRERSPRSTFKLSILFSLLMVLTVVFGMRLLLVPPPTLRPVAPAPSPVLPESPSSAAALEVPRAQGPIVPAGVAAAFEERPTFQGQALSSQVASAADACRQVAGQIAELGRRLSVEGDPSDAVYRGWEEDLGTVATGWVLVDDGLLEEIHRSIAEALYGASDSPTVTDKLLLSLVPPPGRHLEPADLWRGAWMAGTLARIARSRNASAAVVEAARAHLDVALGEYAGGDFRGREPGGPGFAEAAGAWLDRAAMTLVEVTPRNERAYDLWESWIAAERRLGHGERLQRAVMNAIDIILAGAVDLAQPGPTVAVLGRLLTMADFRSSPTVRARVLGFLDDQPRIGARDLWVLTSLLAIGDDLEWFGEDLIVPDDADWLHRRRAADRIAQRWPAEAATARSSGAAIAAVPIEADLATAWLEALRALEAQARPTTARERLERLVAVCWLNEAAARMAFGDQDAARKRLVDRPQPGPGPTGRASAPIQPQLPFSSPPGTAPGQFTPSPATGGGRDGEFTVAWEQTGHNLEERMKMIRALRESAGSDLGPLDADTFVGIVYRGTPPELRELAADVLLEKFTTGPNVALEMLDQLPGAPASALVADTLSRLTGKLLPQVRSESWRADARLALVEFNLSLRGHDSAIDDAAEALLEACDSTRACLEPNASPSGSALAAAEALAEAWRQVASKHETRRGVPATLVELERRDAMRRRLAEGPLQRFVAVQVKVLDLMAHVAAARDPGLREPLVSVLSDSAAARQRCTDVLDQALEAALATARVWALQVSAPPPQEPQQ